MSWEFDSTSITQLDAISLIMFLFINFYQLILMFFFVSFYDFLSINLYTNLFILFHHVFVYDFLSINLHVFLYVSIYDFLSMLFHHVLEQTHWGNVYYLLCASPSCFSADALGKPLLFNGCFPIVFFGERIAIGETSII